ncbi:MAG: hypothetical protein JO010_06005 [Alphaproteobacteria bacterium]|nr:hypothetical protein [Alphaproteobacteria bacterium]
MPQRAKHVMSLVAEAHGGQTYDAAWGRRMSGSGQYADLLRARFELACKKLGFLHRGNIGALDTTLFHPPARNGEQLRLL